MAALAYRLTIYAADGTTTLLTATSDASGTNPYIAVAPTGDGRSVDWLRGSTTVGSYTVQVLDPVTGTATDGTGDPLRLVTSVLADAAARQQLPGKPALVEFRRGAGAWQVLVKGVVTRAALASGALYEIAVGDARRGEQNRRVLGTVSPSFRNIACMIGGPVRGGAPLAGRFFLRDHGPQQWKVVGTTAHTVNPGAGSYVDFRAITLEFVRGPVKPSYANRTGGTMTQGERDELNKGAFQYFEYNGIAAVENGFGWFPRLIAELRTAGSAPSAAQLSYRTPLAVWGQTINVSGGDEDAYQSLVQGGRPRLNLLWDAGAFPAIGTVYDLLLYPADASEHAPLHIFDHPVDVITKLWDDGHDAYDATAAAAARAAVGDYMITLRATAAEKQTDVIDRLCGFFGLGVTFDGAGRRVLRRIRGANPAADVGAPLERVALPQLREPGRPFDVAESGAVTSVAVKTVRWVHGAPGDAAARPLDNIVAQRYERTVLTDDPGALTGEHAVTYDLKGAILHRTVSASGAVTFEDVNLTTYAAAMARVIFDRRTRGAVTGTVPVGPTVVADVGDELVLDVAHLPNAVAGRTPTARRGGPRVVQVLHRTEVPGGADLTVEDAGTEAQPQLTPTLTIAASGADPKRYATISLTNRASLATLGDDVRVETLVRQPGDPTPAATDAGAPLAHAPAATLADTLTTGRVSAGARVYARARAERALHRASPWTAWAGVTLTALTAPTGLSVTVDGADPSKLAATFTPGEVAVPVEAVVRLSGESDDAVRYRWQRFPVGSTVLPLTRDVDAGGALPAVTVEIRHRELDPFGGVSASATAAVAAGTPAVLAPPTDPAGFAGSLDPDGTEHVDGTYGLEVTAAVVPGGVEVWEAIETAAASGTYGTAALRAPVRAVLGDAVRGRTRWSGVAPADGLRRQLTARSVRNGAASAFTAPVVVAPWGASTAPDTPGATAAGVAVLVELSVASYGTSCAAPATMRARVTLAAPLPSGRTLHLHDGGSGGTAVGTIAGGTATKVFSIDYPAMGYGKSTFTGDFYCTVQDVTDATSAVNATYIGELNTYGLANACP